MQNANFEYSTAGVGCSTVPGASKPTNARNKKKNPNVPQTRTMTSMNRGQRSTFNPPKGKRAYRKKLEGLRLIDRHAITNTIVRKRFTTMGGVSLWLTGSFSRCSMTTLGENPASRQWYAYLKGYRFFEDLDCSSRGRNSRNGRNQRRVEE